MAFRLGFGFVPNPLTSMKWWGGSVNLLDGYAPRMFLDFNSGKYEVQSAVSTLANSITVSNNSAIRTYVNQSGSLVTAAANTPRIDWSFGYPRLLLEGAATNYMRNAALNGAVVGVIGSGGSLPTHMSMTDAVGGDLTTQIVSIGTEAGRPYIDVRFYGMNTTVRYFNFESSTSIPATTGQARAFSAYITLVSGTLSNTPDLTVFLSEKNSVGGNATGSPATSTGIKTTASSASRRLLARTITASDCAYVQPFLRIPIATGLVDFTLRISMPQCEAGDVATSPIVTSGTALTRTADLASLHSSASGVTSWAFRGYVPSLISGQRLIGLPVAALVGSGLMTYTDIRLEGSTTSSFLVARTGVFPGDIRFCGGFGPSGRRASDNGSAAAEDGGIVDRPRTTIYIGTASGLVDGQVMYLDELVGWVLPDRPSAAGVQSQARAAT